MLIGVLKESAGETRVAILAESVADLKKLRLSVVVEKNAGAGCYVRDEDYVAGGAEVADRQQVLSEADVLISIHPPALEEIAELKPHQVLLCTMSPLGNTVLIKALTEAGVTGFSMDFIPRTTRAQAMDVLSSMASVAGYKAVLRAAYELPHFFPMYITAAGSIKPSKVLVLGAGVAGLQAIATARRLGAVVEAFDVRSAVKEEVQSLGARFVEVEGAIEDKSAGGYAVEQTEAFKQKQAQVIHEHASKSDVIICTAQIPGKRAPLLIRKETVEAMKPGSVIVDLAASSGGNCEVTQNNQTIIHNGVKVIGESNFPATMSIDASKMYGKNVINFLKLIVDKEGNLYLNFDDDIVKGTCITHQGQLVNDRVKSTLHL